MPKRSSADISGDSGRKTTPQTLFRWKTEDKLGMAEYLVQNFDVYKNLGEKGGRKQDFLRKMRDNLKLECTDKQIKNGFTAFLSKYHEIRAKLNSSGFGIDPEKDSSLEKGWVLKQCPYFEILDKVMGTRPNITPPCIVTTTEIGRIGSPIGTETDSWDDENNGMESPVEIEYWMDTPESDPQIAVSPPTSSKKGKGFTQSPSGLASIIKSSFARIRVENDPPQPKTGIAAFTKMIQEKAAEKDDVENKKLKLDEQKFAHQMEMEKERLQLDMNKVQLEKEIQDKQLEDKKEERAHELRKLELQIQLEQLKSKHNQTS